MKFPFVFFKNKESSIETFIGLFLKEKEGRVLFIEQNANDLRVIAQERFNYTNGWENLTEDVDEALYKMETTTKRNPEKTIFFVFSHLIDSKTGEIRTPYLHKIKDLTKNLDLKPLGYIECHEAIAEYLVKKEEMPTTAILVEMDKSSLGVFVYKGGKLIFQETAARTINIIDDLLPIFEKVRGITILPSRVVLYNSADLQNELAKILGFRWDKNYFIQLPKVELIQENNLLESLIAVFSQQLMSTEVGTKKVEQKTNILGFAIGQDVEPRDEYNRKFEGASSEEKIQALEKPRSLIPLNLSASFIAPLIQKYWTVLSNSIKKLPRFSLPLIGLFIILLALFLSEYIGHKAKIIVFFPAQRVNQNLQVLASAKPKETNSFQINTGKENIKLEAENQTTGKREIGEKATGEVTVHNFDDNEKTFDEGAIIKLSELQFILDSNVKVASSSLAPDGSAKLPGKSKVKVTAAAIGTKGNLSKGQRFEIENEPQSLFFAVNEAAFSGGSEEQIKTVSQQDLDNLKKQVLNKAKNYADSKIESKLKADLKILKKLTEYKLLNPSFSKEVGEEATNAQLKSAVEITYYFYKQEELSNLIIKLLSGKVNKGLVLKKENISYSVESITLEEDDYLLKLKVIARATGEASESEILKKITGKRKDSLEKILKEDFKASGFEAEISDPISFFAGWMPLFKRNIEVQFSYL